MMKKIFLAAVFSLLQSCTFLFFYPTPEIVLTPAELGLAYKDVVLTTPDGLRLHAWDIPAVLPEGTPSKGTILFLHGNAENISTHTFGVVWLVLAGYDLFALDYRGYGQSEGAPDLKGMETDINTALKYLTEHKNGKLFVLGQSLGGSLAIATLAESPYRNEVSGLIVDSAFSSTRRIAREKAAGVWFLWPFQYPLSLLVEENAPDERVKLLSMPTFFVTTAQDRVVPPHHTRLLYENAPPPKEIVIAPKGDHIHAFGEAEVRRRLMDFLEQAPVPGKGSHQNEK